jgi:hypothetical protein
MKKIFYILIIQCFFGCFALYAQQNAYINDFRVNDDSTNFNQSSARIGVDSAGNFVVAWNDRRNFANQVWNQVYCQIFDKNGGRIGNNFKIGHDTTRILGLTVLKDGRFIVFWYTAYNFNQFAELFFQRYDGSGNALSPPTRVVDSTFSSLSLSYGDIACDSIGNFVIAWDRLFGSSFSILYCQRFDSSGNRIGNPVIANEPSIGVGVLDTKICMDFSGNFVCCWRDNRNSLIQGKADIFMQRFNFNGIKIGSNVIVNDDSDSTIEQTSPWISGNGNGNFVITWTDERSSVAELRTFYQVYDSTGALVGVNRRADETNGNSFFPRIALSNLSRFIIGWIDNGYAGRNQFYGRRFTKTGEPIGGIYMTPQSSPGSSTQSPSDIKIRGDRVYSVWVDSRNGNNDIYCNVRSFQNPDTVIIGLEPVSNILPSKFKVHQPYPNPFNPETKIKYELPKSDAVSLRVYDITGREAAFMNLGIQQSGVYEIVISGEKLSSGVYFLQLQTGSGFKSVKKIVLNK